MKTLARSLHFYTCVSLIIIIGLAYGGCGKQEASPKAVPLIGITKPADATLRLGLAGGPPQSLNPLLVDRSVSMELVKLLYNGLLKINAEMDYEPDLAESWSISADGLTYTFNLRKGVRFHDGVEFTSADCAFTYALFKSYPAKAPRQSYFDSITGYQTPDKYTFKIILNKPFSLSITAMGIAVLPKHLLASPQAVPLIGTGQDIRTAPFNQHPVGTGPFRFKEWTTDNHIILERNTDYYENSNDGGNPPSEIRNSQLEIIDAFGYDTQSQWLAGFMRGETDVICFLPREQFEKVSRVSQFKTYRFPYVWTYAVEYDLTHPLFRDKAVRLALAHAVNCPAIIQKIESNSGEPSTGPFIPQTWWHNPGVKPLEYNPALSLQLLNKLGWQPNKQGILERDGQEFRFTMLVNPVVREGKLMAMLLYQELFKLGIRLELQEYDRASGVVPLPDAAAYLTVFCTMSDPAELAFDWQDHSQSRTYAGHSQSGTKLYKLWPYTNPEIDRLFDQGKRFSGIAQRRPIYQQLHQALYDDQPALFLYFHYNLGAVNNRFADTDKLFSPAMPFWTIKDWKLATETQR